MQVPQVNLLPAEVGAQRSLQRTKLLVAAGMIALVLVLGLLYVMKTSQISSAQSDLDDQEQQNSLLQKDINDPELQSVVDKQRQVDTRVAAVAVALTGEVSFHRFLNEISIATPGTVGFNSVNVNRAGAGDGGSEGAADTRGSEDVGGSSDVTAVGNFQVDAKGSSVSLGQCGHPDAATWLDAIDSLVAVDSLWVDSSTRDDSGGGNPNCEPATFTSQGDLSTSILSARSLKALQGELP